VTARIHAGRRSRTLAAPNPTRQPNPLAPHLPGCRPDASISMKTRHPTLQVTRPIDSAGDVADPQTLVPGGVTRVRRSPHRTDVAIRLDDESSVQRFPRQYLHSDPQDPAEPCRLCSANVDERRERRSDPRPRPRTRRHVLDQCSRPRPGRLETAVGSPHCRDTLVDVGQLGRDRFGDPVWVGRRMAESDRYGVHDLADGSPSFHPPAV